jgi:hypothetical protein
VDARQTYQALQARLIAARSASAAGDRERALAEINAALEIDPHFLAAHSLRARLLAPSEPAGPPALQPGDAPPSGSADGYARFEQRAKRRRLDRRLEAARAALDAGRLTAAASALDEIIELDPNEPDLTPLTARFDDLRRTTATIRRGPRMVAAAVFVLSTLAASWLHESTSLVSRPMIASSPLVDARIPLPLFSDVDAVGTAGDRQPAADSAPPVELPTLRTAVPAPVVAPPADLPSAIAEPAPPAAPVVRTVSLEESPTLVPVATPALPPARAVAADDDNALVKETLQRYRSAYEGLNAQLAQTVWPAVNEAALARAFDGLESQTLRFDVCDVNVRGESATATCQGSARYVPKIGSREPRVEPRVWNFTLHKNASAWKIDSARVER